MNMKLSEVINKLVEIQNEHSDDPYVVYEIGESVIVVDDIYYRMLHLPDNKDGGLVFIG